MYESFRCFLGNIQAILYSTGPRNEYKIFEIFGYFLGQNWDISDLSTIS